MKPQYRLASGLRVPYIAPWSRELPRTGPVVVRHAWGGIGLGYADEVGGADRHHDALWVRQGLARGTGTPALDKMHSARQRAAMTRLLCQVCGEDTHGRADERHLWLVRGQDDAPLQEGELTHAPPIHPQCAREALRDCPHLRQGHVAALVGYPRPWGVRGLVYDRKTLAPVYSTDRDGLTDVPYDDGKAIRWVIAHREVVTLHDVIPAATENLAAAGSRSGRGVHRPGAGPGGEAFNDVAAVHLEGLPDGVPPAPKHVPPTGLGPLGAPPRDRPQVWEHHHPPTPLQECSHGRPYPCCSACSRSN